MAEKSGHFPLQLNWMPTRKFNQHIFDHQHQQLDNFTLMMSALCQDSGLFSSRLFTLLSDLFEIHNRLYCSSEETTKKVVPEDFQKSEQLVVDIDKDGTPEDIAALKVCAETIMLGSSEVALKYLCSVLFGLKADTYFMANEICDGNIARMEMLKLIYEYELFDTLDLVDMTLDHCSQLLQLLWKDPTPEITQINYLLHVSLHLLNNAKVDDDLDGMKYQHLRKYWNFLVKVNEGRFIDKSWQSLEKKGLDSDANSLNCIKFPVYLPDPPIILAHSPLMTSDHFLARKTTLEINQSPSSFKVNSEHDSVSVMEAVSEYAQVAYEAIKTKELL